MISGGSGMKRLLVVFIVLFMAVSAGAEEVFELGEVVVTAKKEAVTQTTTVTEISAEDIKARGATTVAEALELLPGVDVEVGGKGQQFVKIRGFDQTDVLVLIDGVPAYEAYFRELDLSQFPIESISKITVTKGASSVLYGANTMGGVLNIVTKKGTPELEASASMYFGDYGTQHYNLNHGWQIGKINYYLTYAYQTSNGFRLLGDFNPEDTYVGIDSAYQEDGGRRDLSDYIRQTVTSKIGYEGEATKLYFSFDYHDNERGIPTEYYRYWRFTDWKQWHLNVIGEREINDFLTLKVRGFYVNHDDEVSSYTDRTSQKIGGDWFDISRYDDYSAGTQVHAHLRLDSHNLFKVGFNYIFDQNKQREYNTRERGEIVRPGWGAEEVNEAETYTFALEHEFHWKPFSITWGLSYDRFNPIKSAATQPTTDVKALNPQIGILYQMREDTSVHLSFGQKTRFPHMRELYSRRDGNPELDPQRIYTLEVGSNHEFEWQKIKGHLSATYFYNHIRDLIELVDISPDESLYINIGRARIQGVELDFDIQPFTPLWFGMNYTYLWTKDDERVRPLEERPEHKLNFDVRYRFPFGLNLSFQTSYVHRQYQYIYDKKTNTEIARICPDYILLNGKITQEIKDHLVLFAQLWNLTDVNYDEGHGPMPGRNFLAGIELRY